MCTTHNYTDRGFPSDRFHEYIQAPERRRLESHDHMRAALTNGVQAGVDQAGVDPLAKRTYLTNNEVVAEAMLHEAIRTWATIWDLTRWVLMQCSSNPGSVPLFSCLERGRGKAHGRGFCLSFLP